MATLACPRCILLIEDDETLREALGAFLEERGYTTVPAEDVERAIDHLNGAVLARPCLVLADLTTMTVDWARLTGALEKNDQLATLPMALVVVPGEPGRKKRPTDFELLARIVKEHCCGGDRPRGNGGTRSSRGGPDTPRNR